MIVLNCRNDAAAHQRTDSEHPAASHGPLSGSQRKDLAMAGWDKLSGMPTEASLDRYGLGWAVTAPGAHPLPRTGGLNLPAGSTASK